MLKIVTMADYGAVALLTSTQVQADKIPRVLGSIVGFIIRTTSGGGTGAPDAALVTAAIINSLKVTDVNRNPVFDINGGDLPYLAYNNSPSGVYAAGTAVQVTNPSGPDAWFLAWPVRVADQPLTFSLTLETRGTVTGGATCSAMTGQVVIDIVYDDSMDQSATLRMTRNDNVVAAGGSTDLSNKLGQNLNTVHIALFSENDRDDADTTSLTLEANSQVQVETITPYSFVAWEGARTVSGHQGGFFPIPLSASFVSNATTKLSLINTVANTFRLFQFYVA